MVLSYSLSSKDSYTHPPLPEEDALKLLSSKLLPPYYRPTPSNCFLAANSFSSSPRKLHISELPTVPYSIRSLGLFPPLPPILSRRVCAISLERRVMASSAVGKQERRAGGEGMVGKESL